MQFLLTLLYISIASATPRCAQEYSYDLSDSSFFKDKYIKNGIEFPLQYVYEETTDGINKTFGCKCDKDSYCYTKCCPPGFVRLRYDCIKMPEADLMLKNGIDIYYVNARIRNMDIRRANLLYGINCHDGIYREDEKWYMQEVSK